MNSSHYDVNIAWSPPGRVNGGLHVNNITKIIMNHSSRYYERL